MPLSRQTFLKILGITLASPGLTLLSKHPLSDHSAWDELRKLWLDLDNQFQYSHKSGREYQQFLGLLDNAAAKYQGELKALVSAGEIKPQVAGNLLYVYIESAYHIWRLGYPASCYITGSPELESQFSRERLRKQARLLEGMRYLVSTRLETFQRAQDAIQKEISFLSQLKRISHELDNNGYTGAQGWPESTNDVEREQYAQESAAILATLLFGDTP